VNKKKGGEGDVDPAKTGNSGRIEHWNPRALSKKGSPGVAGFESAREGSVKGRRI